MEFGNRGELNAMELNIHSDQAACCDAPENQLHKMKGSELDNESSHCVDGKQEISQASNLGPIKSDTQAVNVLNGDYCGLFTQLSIDYVDIFEILKEEILAAEARELEVNGLLNAGEEQLEESPQVEGFESTFLGDSKLTDIDQDDCQREAQNCSFHNKATDVADTALIARKSEDGEAELPRSASAGLVEDAFLKEVEKMGAEDEAAPLEDNKDGLADRLESADVRDTGLAQDYRVVEEVESSITPSEGGFEQACQNDNKVDHEDSLVPPSVQANGDTFSKEDEGAVTDRGKETLLDSSKGDDGDCLLQNDTSDKLSEHSEDDDYTSSPFSGPIAFSGMLSYSGLISYSGQIPHSGNMSLHSDSSTSTRSFAFPILASDWNSSPAKIGQPDSRYFRRRRRWRLHFCCRRPATLFD